MIVLVTIRWVDPVISGIWAHIGLDDAIQIGTLTREESWFTITETSTQHLIVGETFDRFSTLTQTVAERYEKEGNNG